jgi:hypothetical protein
MFAPEGVQVPAVPAHCGQNDRVQLGQAHPTGYLDPAPDGRLAAVELDLELIDLTGIHRG